MTRGFGRSLYILPFDHRASFQRKLFEWSGALTADQRRVSGEKKAYDRELRPLFMVREIEQLRDAGVEPDVWKIEGLDGRSDCEEIVAVTRRCGREKVGCIILGRGADDATVREWLATTSRSPWVHRLCGGPH